MSYKTLIICGATLALAGCSKAVPTDGFKQLKYGMTLADLKQQGFECEQEGMCSRDFSDKRRGSETLFGQPTSLYVWTDKGRLRSINVNVDISADELAKNVTNEFGQPEAFDYSSVGGRAKQLIWPASNGTSLSMRRTSQSSAAASLTSSAIDYNGPEATAEMRKNQEKAGVKSEDY